MDEIDFYRRQAKRRGFLIGGAGVGGSLFLAACSGGKNNSSTAPAAVATTVAAAASPATGATTAAASSPAAQATQTTGSIKKGGAWRISSTSDPPSIDPYASAGAFAKSLTTYGYSRLFMVESLAPDKLGRVPIKIVPDAAESATPSSDGLTWTVALKGNVKFHPPINRTMTAEDVVFSWRRFTGKLPGGKPAPNSEHLSMIDDVQAADERTVRFMLNRPYGAFLTELADTTLMVIMPKETGTAFDPAKAIVGSGPWIFDRYQPGSIIAFKRNPAWHFGPDRPYFDTLDLNIIKDINVIQNQFLAGNLDAAGIQGLNIGDTKKRIAGVQIRQRDTSGLISCIGLAHVSEPRANAPWTDVRVRRALSMALDRDAILDSVWQFDKIQQGGFDIPRRFSGILPPSLGDFFLDPQKDTQVSPFFKYDPKAAKDLLSQAGVGSGFTVDFLYSPAYGAQQNSEGEVIAKYWSDIGVKTNLQAVDYVSKWIPQVQAGNYEGISLLGQAGVLDPNENLRSLFAKDSAINFGKVNDPKCDDFLKQYDDTPDAAKRLALVLDFQRYVLQQMYYVPYQWTVGTGNIVGYQPNVRGPEQFQNYGYGADALDATYYWKS
jgi:ABC-type transport system substrate-binding protein